MRTFLPLIALVLMACPDPKSDEPVTASEAAPAIEEADPHTALLASVESCKADEECMGKLTATDELLGSCPWYEAVGCSAAVVAAGAACVVTEGEACAEALELVAKIGCCDCLPSGAVQDMCKAI
jgi:hypothetical protein